MLPIVYPHAGLEIQSAIPYAIHQESNEDSHALGSQRSHATRRGDDPNWVHKCQNLENFPHSLWASALTKVALLRPRGVWTMGTIIHNTHVIYGPLVHASGVHEG